MGLGIALESEDNFELGPRPKIAHSFYSSRKKAEEKVVYQCSNAQDRDIKGRKLSTHHVIGGHYKELFLHNPASPSRKSMPSRLIALDIKDRGVVKRGSMYQSSREVRMLKVSDGRKDLVPCLNDDAFLSFELINSTPWGASNESVRFNQPKKEPLVVPLHIQPKPPSVDNIHSPTSNMEFLDLSFRDLPEERSKISISYSNAAPEGSSSADTMLGICLQAEEINSIIGKAASEFVEKVQVEETKCGRHQFFSTGVDANIIYERDAICILPKSFSAKVGISNSYHTEREIVKSSHKNLFSPFKKLLDPIMKSKSLRTSDAASISKLKFFPRSLLNDFSMETQKIDDDKDPSSPAHLHAILKWEFNHGDPTYEFSVKDFENVLSAKTWKTENAFNWMYTFHCCKMKSNIVSHGKKGRHLQPSLMIGQMQVSCYLCSEVSEAGSLDNSALTEFTLYDIAQARRSVEIERSHCLLDSHQTSDFTGSDSLFAVCSSESNSLIETEKNQHRYSTEFDSDPSTFYPWASAHLQPNLEIASIVTQIPFSKNEALENMTGHSSPAYVKVVTPSGRHGLPNREEVGPSSLLDRWRFGGGCDCGGWDMGCPIVVFDNANNDDLASMAGTKQPMVLFVKGKKEKVPALAITATGKGQYAVDFHAQLSALQAFSICIAILHSSEASSVIGQDKSKYKLQSNSLKLILEEEVRHIIEAVAEEKRKEKNRVEQVPPSFFLDPPFSPMGRV